MSAGGPHIPVLINAILKECAPVNGIWRDGTFGAGGYTRALLDAGVDRVIAVDRDPLAFEMAAGWADAYGDLQRLRGRSLQERYAVSLYGEHVVELVHEHRRRDEDADRHR